MVRSGELEDGCMALLSAATVVGAKVALFFLSLPSLADSFASFASFALASFKAFFCAFSKSFEPDFSALWPLTFFLPGLSFPAIGGGKSTVAATEEEMSGGKPPLSTGGRPGGRPRGKLGEEEEWPMLSSLVKAIGSAPFFSITSFCRSVLLLERLRKCTRKFGALLSPLLSRASGPEFTEVLDPDGRNFTAVGSNFIMG